MAEHRWDTAPSAPRLSPPWPGDAAPGAHASSNDEPIAGIETAAEERVPARRRWLLSFRAAVLAVCLLTGGAAGLAVFKGGGAPAEISSVELDMGRTGSAGDSGSGSGSGAAAGSGAGGQEQDPDGGGEIAYGDESGRTDEARGTGASPPLGQPAEPAVLIIHVAGAVARPGVVEVPSGSRTGDAVDAAGGAAPEADLTAVNLAAPLQDGTMVVVPRIGDAAVQPPAGPGTGAGTGAGSGAASGAAADSGEAGSAAGGGPEALLNINTASLQELDSLPRIGPVLAERIIAWREDHGRFSRPEDIDAVPGIGEAMLAALLPLITV